MAACVVFGHWVPRAGKCTQLIEELKTIVQFARLHPDEITCVYVLKEITASHDLEVLVISCFKNQMLYDQFRESEEFSSILKKCEVTSILREQPTDEVMKLASGFLLRPSNAMAAARPHIVTASIRYEPGTRNEGIKFWADVTDYVEKREEGTLAYGFLESEQDENVVYSFERYESKEYFLEIHVPSKAIQENILLQKDIRTPGGLSHKLWEDVGNTINTHGP